MNPPEFGLWERRRLRDARRPVNYIPPLTAPLPLTGVHHVSSLSANIGRSHDFYTRVLGLRPLIRTVNQDQPTMYHLFFGDGAGTPGSDMTVFDIPHAAAERPGNNSITLTTFRIHGTAAFDYWLARFGELGVPHREPAERDGRQVLDFADFEGTQLSLVEDGGAAAGTPWEASPVPVAQQIRGLGYVVVTVPELAPTDAFLTQALALRHDHAYPVADAPEFQTHVYTIGASGAHAEVHVVARDDLPRARYGSGGVHHLPRWAPDQPLMRWVSRLDELGHRNSGVVDRHYFTAVYVREPNHVLFELATEGPGFEVDGPIDAERLSLPPFLEPRRAEIEGKLRPIDPRGPWS
jgi:glyoxalase family protein